MDKQDRLKQNQAKLANIQQRLAILEQEKQDLFQEALRIDGESRILNEQIKEEETKL